MPNGDNIVAQAADGTQHVFPAGTDVSVIDGAMKRYVMSQSGPQNQANLARSAVETNFEKQNKAGPISGPIREGALQLGEGLGIQPKQTGWDTIKSTLSNFGTGAKNLATQSFGESQKWLGEKGYDSPLSLAATPVNMLAHVIENAATGLEKAGKTGIQAAKNKDTEGMVGAGGNVLGQLLALRAGRATGEGAADPLGKTGLQGAAQEVIGEGASKAKVLGDLHAHAIETQKHIAGVADAVHTDAQQAIARVSQGVDAAKPEGAFDKAEVRDRLNAAMGDTLEDKGQLPTSLKKLTTPEKPSLAGFVNKGTADFVNRLKQGGMENDEIAQALKEQGFQSNEIKAALGEQGAAPGRMTFEEVKQARSDLGRQMGRLQGPAQAAASAAYGELSKVLREGARDAKLEPDWIDANARYKNYMDDFTRSPIAKTLEGENAHDIMEPLAGKSRVQVLNILSKYEPFGMDMSKIGQEVSRSGMGETIMKMSKPTKMDLLLARLSPTAVALRQLGPRLMRNPSVFSAVAGEGFEPKSIPPGKIFPSKVAAAKELKGNPTPFGGEDAMEAARRGAPERFNPTDKSIRRHYEKDKD